MLSQKAKDNNAIFGNSLLIFLIRFFPSLATLTVVILFSRNLSEAEYGSYQNFWVQLLLISAIGTMGIPALLLTYSPSYLKRILTSLSPKHYSGIALGIIATAIIFALVRTYSSGSPWHISLCFFLLYTLNAITESMLIAFRQFKFLLGINLFYAVAFVWLHYGVFNTQYDVDTLFVLLLLPGILKLLLTAIITGETLKRIPAATMQEYTRKDIRSLWLHIGIYDIIQKIFSWVDKFAISLLFTAGISAVYFNGTFDVPFLPLLLGAVSSAALLQMSSLAKRNDNADAIRVTNQTAKMLSAVVFPLFFFLFFFRNELFIVLLTDKYAASVPIFAITVLIVPLRAYNFTSVLQNRHKGQVINIGAILDLALALALMYPLYLVMGLAGIAASFVISSYIQGAYYLYQISKALETPVIHLLPVKNWLVKFSSSGILFFICHYLLSMRFTLEMTLILGCFVVAATILIAVAIEFRASKK